MDTAAPTNSLGNAGFFDNLRWTMSSEDECALRSDVEIGGVPFHARALRVKYDNNGVQVGTKDPHGRLDDLSRLCGDGPFKTVTIDGLPGLWVVWFEPFTR